jgi:hypothetical protein
LHCARFVKGRGAYECCEGQAAPFPSLAKEGNGPPFEPCSPHTSAFHSSAAQRSRDR